MSINTGIVAAVIVVLAATLNSAMERKSFENAPCSIARSLDVLGDWWAPLILKGMRTETESLIASAE